MVQELTDAIKVQLYDRISSPLTGAFALSWIGWNFNFLLICVSAEKLADKLSWIRILYPDWIQIVSHCIAFPFLSAATLILLLPIPNKAAYSYWSNYLGELRKIKQKSENLQLLTVEESRMIRLEIEKTKNNYDSVIIRYKSQIEELDSRLEISLKENNRINGDLRSVTDELAKTQKKLTEFRDLAESINQEKSAPQNTSAGSEKLKIIEVNVLKTLAADHPHKRSFDFLKSRYEYTYKEIEGLTLTKTLDSLSQKGLITKRGELYELTKAGQDFIFSQL